MIGSKEIEDILTGYDSNEITVGAIGSHSALDVCDGAKEEGFPTLIVAEEGRESVYTKYFQTRVINNLSKGVVDDYIVLSKFADVMTNENQAELRNRNVLFVPNRSFVVYVGISEIENDFMIPIVGSRDMLRIEEREEERNYYWLCERANIPTPTEIEDPEDIDTLVMVKLPSAEMPLERGFFTAASYEEYVEKSNRLIQRGVINSADLNEARIERYVMGPVFNFDFFYSPLDDEIELLGVDWRFETNLDGLVRVPADQQLTLPERIRDPLMIVVGHANATLRESQLNKVFPLAEKFVDAANEYYEKGIIGPFCLQTMIDEELGFWVYDVATRIGGGTNIHMSSGHPYGNTLFRSRMSSGRRLALEIKRAIETDELERLVT